MTERLSQAKSAGPPVLGISNHLDLNQHRSKDPGDKGSVRDEQPQIFIVSPDQ